MLDIGCSTRLMYLEYKKRLPEHERREWGKRVEKVGSRKEMDTIGEEVFRTRKLELE